MSNEIVYFVHGTTSDNAELKCSGWKQAQLNELGRKQAKELGKKTKYKFDILFTSDLDRAVQSANLAWPEFDIIKDERLRECNYGEYDGKDKKLVIYEEHIYNPFPKGESLKDVENRMTNFLKEIKEKYNGKKIGIVSHRAPQLALEVVTKKISWEQAIEQDWRKTKNWKPGWIYKI